MVEILRTKLKVDFHETNIYIQSNIYVQVALG